MAQLAFAAAGTAIGAMFGAPQLGFLAGSLVGTLLFSQKGPDVTSEGPRLGDLIVSSSAYGAPTSPSSGRAATATSSRPRPIRPSPASAASTSPPCATTGRHG
jgi:hypothetical protein